MTIDFSALASHETGWRDGLHWLDEIRDWSERYESINMRPAETNYELALAHLDVVFLNVPRCLHYTMHYLVATLVGERVRQAMMLPQPPRLMAYAIECIFMTRKLILRHSMLPRPEFLRRKYISASHETNGRYSSCVYLSHPWYVKPTLMRRWGPAAWFTRLIGRKLPGDDGSKYRPEGYLIPDIGPARMSRSGARET